jgi:hypothetical protein
LPEQYLELSAQAKAFMAASDQIVAEKRREKVNG